jgi:hypothetical protein
MEPHAEADDRWQRGFGRISPQVNARAALLEGRGEY